MDSPGTRRDRSQGIAKPFYGRDMKSMCHPCDAAIGALPLVAGSSAIARTGNQTAIVLHQ
jgi:hypothetical protein